MWQWYTLSCLNCLLGGSHATHRIPILSILSLTASRPVLASLGVCSLLLFAWPFQPSVEPWNGARSCSSVLESELWAEVSPFLARLLSDSGSLSSVSSELVSSGSMSNSFKVSLAFILAGPEEPSRSCRVLRTSLILVVFSFFLGPLCLLGPVNFHSGPFSDVASVTSLHLGPGLLAASLSELLDFPALLHLFGHVRTICKRKV